MKNLMIWASFALIGATGSTIVLYLVDWDLRFSILAVAVTFMALATAWEWTGD